MVKIASYWSRNRSSNFTCPSAAREPHAYSTTRDRQVATNKSAIFDTVTKFQFSFSFTEQGHTSLHNISDIDSYTIHIPTIVINTTIN